MIGKLIAVREVQRMSGLEYFGTLSDAAVNELVKALTYADSEIVAVGVVNEIIAERRDRPTPSDIYASVSIHNTRKRAAMEGPEKPLRPVYHCERCQDSGLYGGEFAGPNAGEWKACSCPAGNNPNLYDAIKEANAARKKIMDSQFALRRKFETKRAPLPLETQSKGLEHATRDASACLRRESDATQPAGFQGQGR